MLAGPGSITSVMVLVGQVKIWWQMAAILGSIFVTAIVCFLVLGNSDKVAKALGETGISHPGARDGSAAGGAGGAVLRQRPGGPGCDYEAAWLRSLRVPVHPTDGLGTASTEAIDLRPVPCGFGWRASAGRVHETSPFRPDLFGPDGWRRFPRLGEL